MRTPSKKVNLSEIFGSQDGSEGGEHSDTSMSTAPESLAHMPTPKK